MTTVSLRNTCQFMIVLKQRSYARDNEESELIPTSLMTRKEKRTKTQEHVSWNFQDQNFTIGGGGVEQPIYTYIPVSNE